MNKNLTKSLILLSMALGAQSVFAAQNGHLAKLMDGKAALCNQEDINFTNRQMPHKMILEGATEDASKISLKLRLIPVSCTQTRNGAKWAINQKPLEDSYQLPGGRNQVFQISSEIKDLVLMATTETDLLSEKAISNDDYSNQNIIEISVPNSDEKFVDLNLKATKVITNKTTGFNETFETQWGAFRYIKGNKQLMQLPRK